MIGRLRKRIARIGTDRFRVALPEPERDLLRSLAPQLRSLLTTDDPSLRRLFPSAYPDDPERDAGYQALTHDELLERRFAALDLLQTTVVDPEVELSGDELASWMRSVNELRLVLGTRLDVSEEGVDLDPDDPDAPAYAIYEYLGMLLTLIVDALASELPDGPVEP